MKNIYIAKINYLATSAKQLVADSFGEIEKQQGEV